MKRRPARANKPKALSTPVKRGAANREWFARNACSFVSQNSSLPEQVVTFFGAQWRCLSSTVTCRHFRNTRCHSMAHSGEKAPNRAKQRQPTPQNANRRQAATTRDEKRQEASRVRSFIPAVLSRLLSSRKWSVTGSRNFLRGKTDNKEWQVRVAQANTRIHRAPCRSTRATKATNSARDLSTSGSPRPSGTR